jgi:hypothetical protein
MPSRRVQRILSITAVLARDTWGMINKTSKNSPSPLRDLSSYSPANESEVPSPVPQGNRSKATERTLGKLYIPSKKHKYEEVSKIFRSDAVKIIKLTVRHIGRHHPRSSSHPHVDTGPTVSSIFGTLPGIPFLSECQALSAIQPGSPQWYQTGVLSASTLFLDIGRSHRVPNY